MCWSSLNANDALDGLLAEDWVAETRGHMRELLIITPLDFPFVTLVVIIVACRRPCLKSLLMVDFLGLRKPGARRLSPPVIELKVDVVQVRVDVFTVSRLVVLGRDVTLFFQILRSNLCDVHINQVSVVPVNLHHLIRVLTVNVDVVVGADMLVRQDHLWLTELVARSIHIGNLKITSLLLLIDLEEEVLLGDNFVIGILGKFLSTNLIFEFD